jgi:hypothetical protein
MSSKMLHMWRFKTRSDTSPSKAFASLIKVSRNQQRLSEKQLEKLTEQLKEHGAKFSDRFVLDTVWKGGPPNLTVFAFLLENARLASRTDDTGFDCLERLCLAVQDDLTSSEMDRYCELVEPHRALNATKSDGTTIMHFCMTHNVNLRFMQRLHLRGAPLDTEDSYGQTPIVLGALRLQQLHGFHSDVQRAKCEWLRDIGVATDDILPALLRRNGDLNSFTVSLTTQRPQQ